VHIVSDEPLVHDQGRDMTCIVGIEHDGKVTIGGDSAAAQGSFLDLVTAPKVFQLGEMLIGFSYSFRMGQLLQYKLEPSVICSDADLMQFMVNGFVEDVRSCFRDGGFAKKQNEQEEGGQFLVGLRGQLFEVHSNYQVLRSRWGYNAIGCGYELALGAMGAMHSLDAVGNVTTTEAKVIVALQAASDHSGSVQAPFTVLTV
jgi:ATP-dependent protease HslVU (ClpYQ) peptidase subunit